ncbi:MAG: hypothetical protein A2381_18555 [Bdellovibrionales bacterium RIFOXYB1_FULL_37_110]|nr:MAG: hypothetical protein A2417_01215 [Bdellovibrionales bacterium RIFOXYC1_FULL_37_79]OFZ55350.1 MAG: hypothetical protein A2328_12055 [Bdellovibrionales bacterium RIFOXYB2_FULL_36_6]OFZ59031.1 MAG: hypothetical protein A2381_18555 [Bdellovibrionales bacterium RIFOXYB1_FULL_37_110]OFZ65136.1 MAG: hypothetical protein A2577_04870 [Bdellovibrionales bacterium RIFOXYD1_FULL_36_51]
MVFLFSFFSLSQLAVATGLEISFYCDKKDQYLYKNISCCLTRISQDKCEELIDRNLKASTLLQIDSTLNSIRNDMWPWGGYPNCFWNAISYHDQDMGNNPGPLEVQQFEYYLENDYSPIGEEKLESGDMIVFDANYLYWEMGLYMKREWSQINDEPFHAVIHLGNGFAFQKESALNEVFSIDRIDFIRTQINIWIKKLSHSKDQYTTTRFYRRNF